MQKSVIIVAGGSGLRMGHSIPKQFLLLNGKPILLHTIERFFNYDNNINLVIVLPQEQVKYWKQLCTEHNCLIPHQIAPGGSTRFQSVKSGLSLIHSGIIAIHDGVRPFPSTPLIATCFEIAKKNGNAVPAIPSQDSIRHIKGGNNYPVDRSSFRFVQTPQVFTHTILQRAYSQKEQVLFTDDASVVQELGESIHLVEGERNNLKITTPADLDYAHFLIQNNTLK